MKKTLINIVVLLLFSASIIIGCAPKKVQKAEPSMSHDEFVKKHVELDNLFEKGSITKDEYYKRRKELLEEF